ncbi:cell division protein FtsQ/DivIB [Vagococcus elongatus]|uniref:Cell division protein DivIB n=1 Tax=Vagococcus elongatus TaxID=180344 RepID=A0A430AYD5_9ENTE|nr:cell division protein FtsQ/DivIB [Vagococcus elongatus]RSU13059.1 hypothetical protein CBF29_05155 [Vagococcus elongatus]
MGINKKQTDNDSENNKKLTPWQQENLKYLEQEGKEPQWLETPKEEEVEKLSFKGQDSDASDHSKEKKVEVGNTKFILLETSDEELDDDEGEEKVSHEKDEDTPEKLKELPKSKSFADKLPKMKEKRRHRLKRRLLLIVGIFGVATLALIYYVSPISKLSALEIAGNEKVSEEAIAMSTKYKKDQFFWEAYFDSKALDDVKKNNPRIKSVNRSISHINNILLTVEEYKEVAYAKKEGAFFLILENGLILDEEVEQTHQGFPVFTNFENGDKLEKMMSIYHDLDQAMQDNIIEVILSPTEHNVNRVVIRLKDENQIIGSVMNLDEKIGYYHEVASQMSEPGVVDMEAGVFTYSFATKESYEQEKVKREEQEKLENQEDLENTE